MTRCGMETFLPRIYEPCDNDPNRFTYLGGSTTGGAVVYDGGKYLYSHHATDPCGGRLVNAFDLVRLHRFGDLDDDAAPGTPTNKLPSYRAMPEVAVADSNVTALLAQERATEAQKDFAGVTSPAAGGGASEGQKTAESGDDPNAWMTRLRVNPQTGAILPTIDNICIILENDPRLKGKFALNEFADRIEGTAPLPWGNHGAEKGLFYWKDADDAGLYWYMEKVYNITKRGNIDAALEDHLARNTINPVRKYLESLTWDGVPRLDTLFIDYLGAADNAYTRAVTRKSFTAAVARAMTPGCKFDQMLIISGPQGIGKSRLLGTMAGAAWFTDSLRTFEGKDASELLQGVWLVEIAELQAFGKSDVARIKQFLSSQDDRYRAAYGHRSTNHPRRCVFFGTCNPQTFLRDPTGGRRFWPVYAEVGPRKKSIDKDLPGERDQLWAEAKVRWQLGESLYLTGELEREALEVQEAAREVDEREGLILEFLDKPIPADWQKWPLVRRRDFWAGGVVSDGLKLVPRDRVCAMEIWCELFSRSGADLNQRESRSINDVLENASGWSKSTKREYFGPHGRQRGFVRRA